MSTVMDRPGRGLFLREFLRSPQRIASVMPSSSELAQQMVAALPRTGNPVVVELGPGTGVFTGAIARGLAGRGRLVAIERNPAMAGHVAQRFPAAEVVCGAAAELPAILAARGITAVDLVVSGLPWSAFSEPIVGEVARALSPAGAFTQFSYAWTRWAPPARTRHAQLRAAFDEVLVTRTIWRNLPPAFVYVARRPRSPVAG
jgi:phosphatidylethanolamine/phosphatidyl-N-methylethanolamine N-methyltransferase